MRQALHIFRKDTRYLRYPIIVLLGWTVVFAAGGIAGRGVVGTWSESTTFVTSRLSNFLFPLAWWYLVARVFHAEALPDDRQFWLTRPYSRASLLVAKAMFIAAYILLPMALAQAAIVVGQGLPLAANLPGLIWEQLLIFLCGLLPAVVVGTLTTSLVQFIPAMALVPIVLIASESLVSWGPVGWVRYALALCLVLVTGAAVIFIQFTRRRTNVARLIALCGLLAVVASAAALSWRPAFAFQSSLGETSGNAVTASIHVPRDVPAARSTNFYGQLQIRFDIAGREPDTPISCHAGELTVVRAGRTIWQSGRVPIGGTTALTTSDVGCTLWVRANDLLDQVRDNPVDISAVVDLTVFGPATVTTLEANAAPRFVDDIGLCNARTYYYRGPRDDVRGSTSVSCRSAFRAPRGLVEFMSPGGGRTPQRPRSYSPFPTDLRLDPIDGVGAMFTESDRVQVSTRPVVAHITRTTSLRNVRLTDFEVRLGR